MLAEPGSSTSCGGVASFLRLLDRFLFDMLGGFGPNLTFGMNGICSASYATMACNGTYVTMSFIIGIDEGVLTSDSAIVLVLEIDMAILYKNKFLESLSCRQNNSVYSVGSKKNE